MEAKIKSCIDSTDKQKAILTLRSGLNAINTHYQNDNSDGGKYARLRTEQANKFLDTIEN